MIKYQIKEGDIEVLLHISQDGDLVIEPNGEKIVIKHAVALELINIISSKLYEHQMENTSIFKRFFK